MSATAPLPDYPAAGAASWCELNEFAVLDFLNFADNENIEFGFESILSKNVMH